MTSQELARILTLEQQLANSQPNFWDQAAAGIPALRMFVRPTGGAETRELNGLLLRQQREDQAADRDWAGKLRAHTEKSWAEQAEDRLRSTANQANDDLVKRITTGSFLADAFGERQAARLMAEPVFLQPAEGPVRGPEDAAGLQRLATLPARRPAPKIEQIGDRLYQYDPTDPAGTITEIVNQSPGSDNPLEELDLDELYRKVAGYENLEKGEKFGALGMKDATALLREAVRRKKAAAPGGPPRIELTDLGQQLVGSGSNLDLSTLEPGGADTAAAPAGGAIPSAPAPAGSGLDPRERRATAGMLAALIQRARTGDPKAQAYLKRKGIAW